MKFTYVVILASTITLSTVAFFVFYPRGFVYKVNPAKPMFLPSEEEKTMLLRNYNCTNYAEVYEEFSHLSRYIASCTARPIYNGKIHGCKEGGLRTYAFCVYRFVYTKDGYKVLTNMNNLKDEFVPVSDRFVALDYLKLSIYSSVVYEMHYGNVVYGDNFITATLACDLTGIEPTNIKEVDNNYEITLLRKVRYSCVPPQLVQERYKVTKDGEIELIDRKERNCIGLGFCYD